MQQKYLRVSALEHLRPDFLVSAKDKVKAFYLNEKPTKSLPAPAMLELNPSESKLVLDIIINRWPERGNGWFSFVQHPRTTIEDVMLALHEAEVGVRIQMIRHPEMVEVYSG